MNDPASVPIRFPVNAKILLGFSPVLILVAALSFYVHREMDISRKLAEKMQTYNRQMSILTGFSRSADSLEKQVDTYFVTPYIQYRVQACIDIKEMIRLLNQFHEITTIEAYQGLEGIKANLSELHRLTETVFTKITDHMEHEGSGKGVTNYEISRLYRLILSVKKEAGNLLMNNAGMLQKIMTHHDQRLQKLGGRFIIVSSLSFLVCLAAAVVISKSISRPVERLRTSTEAFALGKTDIQVAVTSNDEIGDLAQAFNRMTKTLIAQEDKLSRAKKMENLGLLAGGVAHDLNNVLTGILGYPQLLLMSMAEDDPRRRKVLAIKNSGEKAAAIVQDLLTLARRGVSVNEVMNLNRIVREYLVSPEHIRLMETSPGIRVEKDLDDALYNMAGSPVHIKKTVMNLVSNAAEAQPNGGRIALSTRNCFLTQPVKGYDAVKKGQYAVLSVKDKGLGIEAEDLERIFEPFYTKKSMNRSGSGLGMSIVWGTVEDHNGYIRVDSTVGKGTVMELFFPATDAKASQPARHIPLEALMGRQERILVVDDLKSLRVLAANILEKLNYTVTTLPSGEAAVDYLKTHAADLVILDMIMEQGMDGYEAYNRITRMHPGQKTIITSGFAGKYREKRSLESGAVSFLKKPYRLEDMGLAVKKALGSGHL